jgi:biotin-(acetyl-CoA carboxylase) ligase
MVFQDVQESYLFSPIHLVRAVPCALVQACGSVGVEAQIKWPNDVWISGRLKAAGVLIDTQSLPNRMLRCCVGVGINVNADPALHDPTLALIATCLRKHSKTPGNDVDREAFLASFCDHLEQYLMSSSGAENLERDYRQASLVIGRHVTVYPADTSSSSSSTPSPENTDSSRNSYEAVAMDVDSFGFLKVRRIDNGSEVTLSAEEVSIRPT